MKRFFLRHKKLHIWLLINAALLAAFFLLQSRRAFMTAVDSVMAVIRHAVASVCYLTRVSVAEALCVALVIFAVVYLVWSVIAVIRSREKLHRLYSAALGAACVGVTIYTAFCWLWGFTFYIDGFQEKSGIYAQPVAKEDLLAVTEYFSEEPPPAASGKRTTYPLLASSRPQTSIALASADPPWQPMNTGAGFVFVAFLGTIIRPL